MDNNGTLDDVEEEPRCPLGWSFSFFLASISHNFSCSKENKNGKKITNLFPFSEANSSVASNDFCNLIFLIYSCTYSSHIINSLRGACS